VAGGSGRTGTDCCDARATSGSAEAPGHPLCGLAGRRAGAFRARSVACARPCDCDEVAEHALSGELRAGAGSDDRGLSDRTCPANDRVAGALDVRQRIVAGNELGLHARSDTPRFVWLGELERCDVLEPRPAGRGPVYLRESDIGDSAAGDLIASKLSAEERSADRIITLATASWPSTSAAGSRSASPARCASASASS
jgi:hypothetical protein